ncbi:hypothetical protein Droror1_Dr00017226 [Drosera rotundifolia]
MFHGGQFSWEGCGSGKRVKVGGDGEDEQKKVLKRSNQSDSELSLKEAENNENSSPKDSSDGIVEAETVEQDNGVDVETLSEKVSIKAVPKKLKDLLDTSLLEGMTVRYKRGLKMRALGDLGLLGVISGCGILSYCDGCQGTNVSIGRSFADKFHQLKTSVLLPSNPRRMTVQVLTKRLRWQTLLTCSFEVTRRIRLMESDTYHNDGPIASGVGSSPMSKRHMPILAMTADVIHATYDECLKCEMDGYVFKPLVEENLFQAISKIFKQNHNSDS